MKIEFRTPFGRILSGTGMTTTKYSILCLLDDILFAIYPSNTLDLEMLKPFILKDKTIRLPIIHLSWANKNDIREKLGYSVRLGTNWLYCVEHPVTQSMYKLDIMEKLVSLYTLVGNFKSHNGIRI